MLQKTKAYIPRILSGLILIICLWGILRINFAGDPALYQTDMYTDMAYAVRVWETKSLFPEGWVFGNQLYVLATPVLAAVFYGLCGDAVTAMGIASTVMTALVLLSFWWMLKCVLHKGEDRLTALVLLVSLSFLVGDPVYSLKGWQLFFTMCSYYACYLIAAFLAFGCYLRSDEGFAPSVWAALGVACLFSFATGVQSLRQTAVMICPLLAVEGCRFVLRAVKKQRLFGRSVLVVGCLTACNVLGLVCARVLPVAQVEIFGSLGFNSVGEMLRGGAEAVMTALSMLVPAQYTVLLIAVAVIGVPLWCIVAYVLWKARDGRGMVCLLLFTASPLVILAIDVMTTMAVRDIYYFMLIPMAAVAAGLLYARGGKLFRGLILLGVLGLFGINCLTGLLTVPAARDKDGYKDVAQYLSNRGVTTVYSAWNCAERVAMASQGTIDAGFWDLPETSFRSIRYLCDPAVYDAEPAECAYLFYGMDAAIIASDMARQKGAALTELEYFPAYDLYIYTCDVNLME